ncbi:MAG: hypothetical protein IH594_01000 [Bacteroidales bacterium]|nr:hypothetical protein [Bacteroidales bacterium]
MGFTSADPSLDSLVKDLAREYDLVIEAKPGDLKKIDFIWDRSADYESQAKAFANAIRNLRPGTYL